MSLFGRPTSTLGGSTSAFGQPANNSGSVFGQSMNQNQNQNQQQQPQSSAFGGSLLGQPQGQNQNQQQQSNAFGGSLLGQNQQQQPNAFGASLLGQSQAQQPQQQQQQGFMNTSQMNASQAPAQRGSLMWEPGRESTNHKPVTDQMQSMLGKWHPGNPNTVFKHYFYNKVDQSRVPFYQPGPGEDPREWEQAVHDKPAPGYMPALATGFEAVNARLRMQQGVLANYRQALHAINSSLDAILSQNDLQTSVRALNARRKHAILRQRCLALATKVQVLRNRGYSLDKEEDELQTKLEVLDRGISDPAVNARTEELWSRLILLRGYADTLRNEIERRGTEAQEGLGEELEARAKKILEDYDKQLQTLKVQVDSIKKDYDQWQAEAKPATK